MKLLCPKCQSDKVTMIDHQPQALGEQLEGMQFDTVLLGEFRCSNCSHEYQQQLTVCIPKAKPKFFLISGYWKEIDNTKFEDYLVCDTEYDSIENVLDVADEDVFYYGLNELQIKEAIEKGLETDFDFVITSYQTQQAN
jgi:Zn finger protein HypA/HybF involved in hydrogenase expression